MIGEGVEGEMKHGNDIINPKFISSNTRGSVTGNQ